MKGFCSLAAGLLIIGAFGCKNHGDPDLKPRGPVNRSEAEMNQAIVQAHETQAADNAIIRQHTLYPYHFVENSATLNALGEREAHVLASHFKNNPGPLNLRRGPESDALYQARSQAVKDAMTAAGVAADRIAIADGMPGGDGMGSSQVVLVLERMTRTQSGATAATPAQPNTQNKPKNKTGTMTGDQTP